MRKAYAITDEIPNAVALRGIEPTVAGVTTGIIDWDGEIRSGAGGGLIPSTQFFTVEDARAFARVHGWDCKSCGFEHYAAVREEAAREVLRGIR